MDERGRMPRIEWLKIIFPEQPLRTRLTLCIAALAVIMPGALRAGAQPKPFTQDQVQGMVRAGLGDETGAKAISERGIDFVPTEEFLQSLKGAGANDAFLAAVRAAKQPQTPSSSASAPLTQIQIFSLLLAQVPTHRIAILAEDRGIDFDPTDDFLKEVRLVSDDDELIKALKEAKVIKPEHTDPALQARQDEVHKHVARAAELLKSGQNDAAATELRQAVDLNPQDSDLHFQLGVALSYKQDWDGAIAEEREAIRLNPSNERAHSQLGVALGYKRDFDQEIAEQREALRLNPNDWVAHLNLGFALGGKKEWDEAITEGREAIRLNPGSDAAHLNVGVALGNKGDYDAEIVEMHEALRLNPNNALAHADLGVALMHNKDWNAAISEFRTTVSLNPKDDLTHVRLGLSLGNAGDWQSAIGEERQALVLNPNNDLAHFCLGMALERTGDSQGALQEYRTAYELNPRNAGYQQAYERLLNKR